MEIQVLNLLKNIERNRTGTKDNILLAWYPLTTNEYPVMVKRGMIAYGVEFD